MTHALLLNQFAQSAPSVKRIDRVAEQSVTTLGYYWVGLVRKYRTGLAEVIGRRGRCG